MSVDVESNCLGFNFLLDEGKRIEHERWDGIFASRSRALAAQKV
jgi:hypothetical protein